ncbi:MAG: hypothetical protein HYX69_11250 [Planctomycetia bacterium]|nr:hypothetical protein [Planctomycetia bacterium]
MPSATPWPKRLYRAVPVAALTLAILAVLVVARPHVQHGSLLIFSEPGSIAALRYDTGYGFNDSQQWKVPRAARSELRAIPAACLGQAVRVWFDVPRGARMGFVQGAKRLGARRFDPSVPGSAIGYEVAPQAALALFVPHRTSPLGRVGIEAPGHQIEWIELAAWLNRGALAIVRTADTAWASVSTIRFEPPPGCFRQVELSTAGGDTAGASTCFLVRYSSATAQLVPLAATPESPSRFASSSWDDAPFRQYFRRPRLLTQFAAALAMALSISWAWRKCRAAGSVRDFAAAIITGVRQARPFPALFAFLLVNFTVWAVAMWPGLVGWDSTSPIDQIRDLSIKSWYSWIYPLFVMTVMQATDHFTDLMVFQTIATAALAAGILTMLVRRGLPGWVAVVVAIAYGLCPVVCMYASFYCRDVLNGLLVCALLAMTYKLCLLPRQSLVSASTGAWAAWTLMAVCAGLLRYDNLPLVVVLLAMIVGFRALALARGLALAAGVLAAIWLGNGPVDRRLVGTQPSERNLYVLTALVNPVGALVAQNYVTRTPKEDRAVIDPILDYERFRQGWNPYSISFFLDWVDRPYERRRFTDDDVRRIRQFLVRAAWNNPDIIAGARTQTFASILGSPRTWSYSDFSREKIREAKLRDHGIWREPPLIPRLHEKLSVHVWKRVGRGSIWWRAHLQLLAVVAALALWPYCKVTAAASAAIVARLAVLFLAAPAGNFFYVYDLYLFGIFVLPMAWTEWRLTRARQCANAAASEAERSAAPDRGRYRQARYFPAGAGTPALPPESLGHRTSETASG